MAVNLKKGGRVNLQKEAPSLKRLRFELEWKPNSTDTGHDFDLDATAFGLKVDPAGNPRYAGNDGGDFMVFYGNPSSIDGSMTHSGDNKTGKGNGPDETIIVDLTSLSAGVDEISFIVTIHEADDRGQNFGQVPSSSIALVDDETNAVIAKYDLEEDFSTETAVQFGSLYRKDGGFAFKAIGAGYNKGLEAFCAAYGIAVA